MELFVRSLAPRACHDRQESLVERLGTLAAEGQVRDYAVHVWGSRVDLSSAAVETETGRFLRDRVEAFRTWRADNGLSTAPFFEEESVESTLAGEAYSAVTLPAATLAEYVDGELDFVTPCTDGDSVLTVQDRIEQLERRGTQLNTARPI